MAFIFSRVTIWCCYTTFLNAWVFICTAAPLRSLQTREITSIKFTSQFHAQGFANKTWIHISPLRKWWRKQGSCSRVPQPWPPFENRNSVPRQLSCSMEELFHPIQTNSVVTGSTKVLQRWEHSCRNGKLPVLIGVWENGLVRGAGQ